MEEQSQQLTWADMQRYAKQCDDDHKCLSQEIIKDYFDPYLDNITPILKQLWAVDYIATMLAKGKNKRNKDTVYTAWGSFAGWYESYVHTALGDLNKKSEKCFGIRKPLYYASSHRLLGMLNLFHKLDVQYNADEFDTNPLQAAKTCGVVHALINKFNVPICVCLYNDSLIAMAAASSSADAALITIYAECGVPINHLNVYKQNALHDMLYEFDFPVCDEPRIINYINSDIEKILLLIAAGIDLNAIDANGFCPLDILLMQRDNVRGLYKSEIEKHNMTELNCYKSVIQLLELRGAHSYEYINGTLPTSKRCEKKRLKNIISVHKQDIAAMYHVLNTSKITQGCEQQYWPVEHQVVKVFADWYKNKLDQAIQASENTISH